MESSRFIEIHFRDKQGCIVEIKISTIGNHVSFMGEKGGCYGQIDDDIEPRTEAQRRIIQLWNEYHLKKPDEVPVKWSYIEELEEEIRSSEAQYTRELAEGWNNRDLTDESNDYVLVGAVEDLLKVDEYTAKKVVAVGRFLDNGFEIGGSLCDLKDIDIDGCYARVMGLELIVGKEEDLKDEAYNYLVDERDYWEEAVRSGSTDLGLKEWAESVIDEDGWYNVLSHYGGGADSYNVAGEWIDVARKD